MFTFIINEVCRSDNKFKDGSQSNRETSCNIKAKVKIEMGAKDA
jgi:hypothetical protein